MAKALIDACETFCLNSMGRDELFIRVESTNEAAVSMYKGLGYNEIDNPDDAEGKIILLNKKLLVEAENDATVQRR